MYLIQRTAFLVLLLHQCIVNGFNILDKIIGFNYFNREINSITSSLAPDGYVMTRWIPQELDHFNSKDNRTFPMKYFESLEYWKENGPIYLFLSNPHPANDWFARAGVMYELAKETHGAMYILEHRYYGDSKPFQNLDVENIKYLSSRQALADIAKLISYLKSLPMYKDSKVVAIGKFYGGNLAAWMKVLYPKLIDAALSGSAPVLAQKDFFKYLEKVKDTYELYGGTDCVDKLTKEFENYDSLFQSPEGILQLKKDEHICDSSDMTVIENQQLFFFLNTCVYSSTISFPDLIKQYCFNLNDKNVYNRFSNEYLKVNNSYSCISLNFQEDINKIRDKRNLYPLYPRLYQSCTEFGQFQTTSSKNQPFLNIPLEFYMRICSTLFGNNFNEKRVDEGVEISNKLYGGLKPNVTKVVFTNGGLDPWSTISVLEDLSPDAQAVVTPRAFGYEIFDPINEYSSEELKEARNYVKYLIRKWIGADDPYYCGLRARVPNFVKATGKHVLPAMTERLTLKESPVPVPVPVPVPSKRYSVAHAHGFPPQMPFVHPMQQALWHARSYESGIDGEHYDPYALYGRLPAGRFPPPPAPNARHMFIGEWD